jgi:uncharacterized membrane protein SpoIIM required for sporulation
MKENQFINLRQSDWDAWDDWLNTASNKSAAAKADITVKSTKLTVDALPGAFRHLCQDLSLARDRNYSSALVYALHDRVLMAHQRIYGARGRLAWIEFLVIGLPQLVRDEARLVMAAAALFFLPLLFTLLFLQGHPDTVYFLMSPDSVAQFEQMYSPTTAHPGQARGASDELTMLAYYIANNVRIDFQCFAGGIAFGLGSIFFLVYNGLLIGAAAGHLTQIGYIETFWGFVAGHSAPELTGAVLSGAAGLKIGQALVAPGRRLRLDALKDNAKSAVRLLYGAAALTFSAAFIESLWSPIRVLPFEVKIGAGIGIWIILLSYFLFSGRSARAA